MRPPRSSRPPRRRGQRPGWVGRGDLRQQDLVSRSRRAVRWLQPGLVVKRWMLTSGLGLLVAVLGAAIWADLQPIYWTLESITWLLRHITTVLPRAYTGPLVLLGGGAMIWLGQSRSFGSIQQALAPEKGTVLVDALVAQRRLNRGPAIVAIGGGTGLSTLLSGLKRYSSNLTAIVTVADDGGSSGVLRRELGVQPPGDVRNCLAALATEEPLLTRLFQYRFQAGTGLEGHSFGNLFLSALTAITGSLESAITASSRVLAVQGQVVPATNADVRLWAELEDGTRIEGESTIGHAPSPIVRLGCTPERPPALPRALEAIAHADLIVLGPGSLYTSLLPNLLVPELVEAIGRSKAPRLYICNLMTQPGETDGLDVTGHLRALEAQLASLGVEERLFTAVLAQEDLGSGPLVEHYRQRGAEPVACDSRQLRSQGYEVMLAPLQGTRPSATLRHDPKSVALAVMRFYKRHRKAQ
ncbi:YvcK family protein [Vulcanococcus limneticus Candia 3F8]|uniref:gluconeogenesis factor YvcK family protein n=1 Tax=Vulcanococcus limneticus TaxID=2170428 RepID=UPI000B99CACB|nr:gluconeogenesis factor YvcK family protein [Vulcanococcus limneticus]MCP9793044.1 YvcK family protein [Vulcanococcus limneticus MW73D5]MCP9894968.1 YvcK family protein [Vulcanococcus limneticus Candia 3F8]MCP9898442.1 YvcK family protein [Vulcanococcus limneticus Candia 3B3]